jgi:small subunit ribosomal protein S8
MTMQDPIADMIVRIKNAQMRGKVNVSLPASKIRKALAEVLKSEGYIVDYQIEMQGTKGKLTLTLKYYLGKPVIENITRVSRPGLRVYKSSSNLPKVLNGLGIAIVSTSKGVMSDRAARHIGEGGEILCYVN